MGSVLPAVAAGMQFFTCWHSQRKNERRFHLATCWGFGVLCLALLPLTEMKGVHQASFVLLILGVVGVFGVEGISVSYYLALMGGEKNVGRLGFLTQGLAAASTLRPRYQVDHTHFLQCL